MSIETKITFIYKNSLTVLQLFGHNMSQRSASRLEAFSRSISPFFFNNPNDSKTFIAKPCHPVMEESVRLSQAEYKMLQRFYHCSAQSNVRTKSARRLHEDTFTQQHRLCQYSEVSGWSLRDSRHCLLASHSGILKEQRYSGIWDSSRKERTFR
jgi:hypothetical protein